jgi:hypothetical protein
MGFKVSQYWRWTEPVEVGILGAKISIYDRAKYSSIDADLIERKLSNLIVGSMLPWLAHDHQNEFFLFLEFDNLRGLYQQLTPHPLV